jgi:hypothetical protein
MLPEDPDPSGVGVGGGQNTVADEDARTTDGGGGSPAMATSPPPGAAPPLHTITEASIWDGAAAATPSAQRSPPIAVATPGGVATTLLSPAAAADATWGTPTPSPAALSCSAGHDDPARGAQQPQPGDPGRARPRHSCPGGLELPEAAQGDRQLAAALAMGWGSAGAMMATDSISGPSSLAGGAAGGGAAAPDGILAASAASAAASAAAASAVPGLLYGGGGALGTLGALGSGPLLSGGAPPLAPDSSVASSESGLSPAAQRGAQGAALSPPSLARPPGTFGSDGSATTPNYDALRSSGGSSAGGGGGGGFGGGCGGVASPPSAHSGLSSPPLLSAPAAPGLAAAFELDAQRGGGRTDQGRIDALPPMPDLQLLQALLQQQQHAPQSQSQQQPPLDLAAALGALALGAADQQSDWGVAAAAVALQRAQATQSQALADAMASYAIQVQAALQAQAAQQALIEQQMLEQAYQSLQQQQHQQQQQKRQLQQQQQQQHASPPLGAPSRQHQRSSPGLPVQHSGEPPLSAWHALRAAAHQPQQQPQQQDLGDLSSLLSADLLTSSSLLGALGLAGGGSSGSGSGGASRRGSRQGDAAAAGGGGDTRKSSADKGAAPRPPPRARDEPPDFRRVFVGNIGWWVDEELLRQSFDRFGAIIDIQVGCRGWKCRVDSAVTGGAFLYYVLHYSQLQYSSHHSPHPPHYAPNLTRSCGTPSSAARGRRSTANSHSSPSQPPRRRSPPSAGCTARASRG